MCAVEIDRNRSAARLEATARYRCFALRDAQASLLCNAIFASPLRRGHERVVNARSVRVPAHDSSTLAYQRNARARAYLCNAMFVSPLRRAAASALVNAW